jgi:tetratricopeptide (TPR) repeat protein
MGKAFNDIGIVYQSQGRDDKALENFNRALGISESVGDKKTTTQAYNNIGNLYSRQGFSATDKMVKKIKLKLALDNFNRGLQLTQKIADKSGEAHAYMMIGNVYYNLGIIADTEKEAVSYYQKDLTFQQKSLQIKETIGDRRGIGDAYFSIGILYYMMDEFEKSESYLQKTLEIYREIGYKAGIKEIYGNLCLLFEDQRDYKKALAYHKLFSALKDSLFNEQSNNRMVEMAAKYQSEKKEQEIGLLTKDGLLKQSELQNERQLRYLILSGIFFLLITGTLFFALNNRRRVREKLEVEKELIELEKKALSLQMNPHFIFNTLSSITSFITSNDQKAAVEYLAKFARLIRLTLEYSELALVPVNVEIEILGSYLALEQLRFEHKFGFEIHTSEEIEDDMAIPNMLVQPYIENAILHGLGAKEGKGRLEVDFSILNGQIHCTVTDDGIGIEKAKEIKSQSPAAYKSMAMEITRKRLEAYNKTNMPELRISVNNLVSREGHVVGTKVEFIIPIQFLT